MTNPQPVEIELKLALPSHQVKAFRKRMARRRCLPEQHVFLTRYFDTPDFELSALGVALRVRRVGRRWLQTLKTEGERGGGLSRRAEYETQVPRNTLDWTRFPDEALVKAPEHLRSQLVPVFETRFKRTAWLIAGKGGAQIEVALDEGEVQAGQRSQPICEIELELKKGQPDALFALALDWADAFECIPLDVSKAERGVRLANGQDAAPVKSAQIALNDSMRVEEGFAAICQACLAQFQANLPGVMESDDIEYVHQARVALRSLRAALHLYRKACVLPEALKEGLHALADALGPARDWDVLCSEILPAIAPCFADAVIWQTGADRLDAHRAGVRADMRAALSEAHPGAWLLACQRWLLQQGWQSNPSGGGVPEKQRLAQLSTLSKWARRALFKGHRSLVRGAREFGQLHDVQRHVLRIAVKRQRYASEHFQALFSGRRQKRYLAALSDVQDSLGRFHDAQVASDLLRMAQPEGSEMELFALGWLAASLADGGSDETVKHLKNFIKLTPYW